MDVQKSLGFLEVQKSIGKIERGSNMKYAYFIDTQVDEERTKNQKLLLLIKDIGLTDDQIFADEDPENKVEFEQLLDVLQAGDTLMVRSVMDLDWDINFLCSDIFPYLSELGVELFSCNEPYLCGEDYAETLKNIIQMVKAFCRSRSRSAYKKAVEEKRVGRPSKTDNVEQAMKLYKSGSYTVSQIETLTGISKSTLYKYLKE